MLETAVENYTERLYRAVYNLLLKDIKMNLKNHIPLCYRSQFDREAMIYIAYCITTLVPEFYLKWWKRVYLPLIHQGIQEMFLQEL